MNNPNLGRDKSQYHTRPHSIIVYYHYYAAIYRVHLLRYCVVLTFVTLLHSNNLLCYLVKQNDDYHTFASEGLPKHLSSYLVVF